MIKNFLSILAIFIILSACGFKIVNQDELRNFNIEQIISSGDKKINYFLKRKLKTYKNIENKKLIVINLNTQNTKSIKEKNIKNEITKYEIKIITEVKYNILGGGEADGFTLIKSGDYDVAEIHSQTLNNEKNLIKILTEKISDEINENLILRINEL